MLSIKNFSIWVLVILLVILSLRSYLVFNGQIGHNWDHTFPYIKDLFQNLPFLSTYTWWQKDFGKPLDLSIAHLIPNYLLAGLVWLMGSIMATKLLITGIILVSIFSFSKLLDYLTEKSVNNIGFAVLYGLSPFLFNDFIGGSWYMWISYATLPLYSLALIKLIQQGITFKRWILFVICSFFVISSLQNFILIEGILLIYIFFNAWGAHSLTLSFKRYVILHGLLFLINLYWILPFGIFFNAFRTQVFSNDFSGGFAQVKNTTQSIFNINNLSGYLDRDMYFYAIPEFTRPIFIFASAWALGLIVFIMLKTKYLTKAIFWLVIFCVLILIVKGGTQPWGNLTMRFYKIFPLMSLYRSPQHLMLVPAFMLPLLVALTYHGINKENVYQFNIARVKSKIVNKIINLIDQINILKLKPYIFVVWMGLNLIWISGWWINGDFGRQTLLDQKEDHVDFFQLSPDLIATYELSENDPETHRILFIPALHSPVYVPNEFQIQAQGGQPEQMYLIQPTFSEETTILGKAINEHFCDLQEVNWLNLAAITNVKYVTVRDDIYPIFSSCRNNWNINQVYKEVKKQTELIQLIGGKHTVTYELDKSLFLPRIYTADKIIYSSQTEDKISQLVSVKDFNVRSAIYFNSKEEKVIKTSTLPDLEIKQISPVKYRIVVKNIKDEFPLIFAENFHPQWKLYLTEMDSVLPDRNATLNLDGELGNDTTSLLNDQKQGADLKVKQNNDLRNGWIMENWFRKPIFEDTHLEVNSYANSWLIDPLKICSQNLTACKRDTDGTYNWEMVIEFWPQRLFYIGILISLIAILFSSIYVYKTNKDL